MYRILKTSADTYITDRVIRKKRTYNANVGQAGTLDLFKLYGVTSSGSNPNNELSRILIKFDLTSLKDDFRNGIIDINDENFNVSLNLIDVFGGQPTPTNFSIEVLPLSSSWDEGIGQDVVFYQDTDNANFLTRSYVAGETNLWFASGANSKGILGSSNIDVVTSNGNGLNFNAIQSFKNGTENLDVNVTHIVSSTLCGILPDNGFRVSFTESQEQDQKTRFVKRFGSSQASDPYSRPKLIVRYDDAITSNDLNFVFDYPGSIFMHNSVRGNLTNVLSGSARTEIMGDNCMLLKLVTPVSTSAGFINYENYVTASQYKIGNQYVTGTYFAKFTLDSTDQFYSTKLIQSGSVKFDKIWSSFDGTVSYQSGSLTVYPTNVASYSKQYFVNITNLFSEYLNTDVAKLNVYIFDNSQAYVKMSKTPFETPSVILENVYYSVRDAITNKTVIPFDELYNSTKLSNNQKTMYFNLWCESLVPGRTYVIDILVIENGNRQIYRDASPIFKVVEI